MPPWLQRQYCHAYRRPCLWFSNGTLFPLADGNKHQSSLKSVVFSPMQTGTLWSTPIQSSPSLKTHRKFYHAHSFIGHALNEYLSSLFIRYQLSCPLVSYSSQTCHAIFVCLTKLEALFYKITPIIFFSPTPWPWLRHLLFLLLRFQAILDEKFEAEDMDSS